MCISFNRHQIYYFYFYFYSYKGRHHNYMTATRMLMICLFIPSDIIFSHLFYLFILFSSHLYTKYHIDLYVYRMDVYINSLRLDLFYYIFFLYFFCWWGWGCEEVYTYIKLYGSAISFIQFLVSHSFVIGIFIMKFTIQYI